MGFIDDIKARAKTSKKTIVLPETEDIRTYEAAEAVLKEGTANLILVRQRRRDCKEQRFFRYQRSNNRRSCKEREDRRLHRKTCRIT